jgi:hypothetical protein
MTISFQIVVIECAELQWLFAGASHLNPRNTTTNRPAFPKPKQPRTVDFKYPQTSTRIPCTKGTLPSLSQIIPQTTGDADHSLFLPHHPHRHDQCAL